MEKPTSMQLKRWKRLTLEKYRREEGAFLVEGEKVVGELLKSGWPARAILICPEMTKWKQDTEEVPVFQLTKRQWGALSQDKSPEGVMAVASRPDGSIAGGMSAEAVASSLDIGPLLLLYQAANPNNIGALIRTAHWFGFGAVVLSRNSCEAVNPKAVRASMGGIFHIRMIENVDFERFLPAIAGRFAIVGSDVRTGTSPHPCGRNTALLLGSESHGLPEELLALTKEKWKIPGAGGGESLSLPQAGAIMMYACVRDNII